MLEIRMRPQLLDYLNTITVDGVVLTIGASYHIRTDDWWISFWDEELQPILLNRRVVLDYPLNIGVQDERMPAGIFVALRLGEGADAPRAGEFGDEVRLTLWQPSDFEGAEQAQNPNAPRAVVKVEGVI